MKHKIILLYTWLVRSIFFFFPDQPLILRFRGFLYSFAMKECGRNFQVSSDVVLRTLENINCGDDVYLAPGVVINATGKIYIHDQVMVGFNSVLVSGNHSKANGSYRFSSSIPNSIVLRKGSWVGANATVLSGGELPEGCVLGANSVLTKRFVSEDILAGVPAKPIIKP